jgi:hypothetical protein
MTIANFFWHGSELSLYEEICLKSFVKNNFIVNLYSYQKFKKINGVNNIDANQIINEDFLNKYTHDNKKGCLAAFSDEFRILLMKLNKGWWFDIDIICLKDAKDFDELDNNKNIVAGYEDSNKNISNGILKINNQEIVTSILSEIKRYGTKFSWGMIGPNLLKRIVKKYSFLEKEIVHESFFFPVNFSNFQLLFIPKDLDCANSLFTNAYVCHFYNQILNRFSVPKNILPPKNSYLYKLFIKIDSNLINQECLPLDTYLTLTGKRKEAISFFDNIRDLIPSLLRTLKKRF